MMIQRTLTLVAVLALAATPVAGQRGQEQSGREGAREMRGMMGQDMDMMSMSRMMGRSPAMLLRRAERLGLDDTQRAELEEIEQRFQAEHKQHMEEAKSLHDAAAEALAATAPDWEAYGETLGAAAQHMAMAHVSMVRAGAEAKAVLTAEQLEMMADHSGMGMMGSEKPGHMEGMAESGGMEGMSGMEGMKEMTGERGTCHGSEDGGMMKDRRHR